MQDKLLKEAIKKLLIKMHKGESLVVTLNKILDVIGGVSYIQKRHFIYMLQGMKQDTIRATPKTEEDEHYINGHNDSADENNFAIELAIDVIMGKENYEDK